MKNVIKSEKEESNEMLLDKLSSDVKCLLSHFGTLSIESGDYWVGGVKPPLLSVEVLVFAKINFTPELLSSCSTLLDSYPDDFRIRFIEAGNDGEPLNPLGGLELSRYGYNVIS